MDPVIDKRVAEAIGQQAVGALKKSIRNLQGSGQRPEYD